MNNPPALQEHWDETYREAVFETAGLEDEVRRWIERFLPARSGNCFEAGCFPGRYLSVLGERGWVLNGIDLTPRVDTDLVAWLQTCGYALGSIRRGDFLAPEPALGTYDLVCSFGFIEHFEEVEEVLRRHARLVAPGGLLMVSAPNFSGFWQKTLHRLLDRVNFERHRVRSIDPARWAACVRQLGFEVVFSGRFGRFDFWVEAQPRSRFQELVVSLLERAKPSLALALPESSASLAPWCGLVARRRDLSSSP